MLTSFTSPHIVYPKITVKLATHLVILLVTWDCEELEREALRLLDTYLRQLSSSITCISYMWMTEETLALGWLLLKTMHLSSGFLYQVVPVPYRLT